MLTNGGDAEREALMEVARLMCLAARTAPKGGGVDMLDERVRICYGIPLSAKGKNPHFDKEWKRVYGVEGWTAR